MPGTDIEKPYQDRYTLAPPSRRRLNPGPVVHFAAAVYAPTLEMFARPGTPIRPNWDCWGNEAKEAS
jgi:hypothetical protein